MSEQPSVSAGVYRGLAVVVRIIMLVAVAAGIMLLARIVLLFFDSLKTVPGYDMIIDITTALIEPLEPLASIEPVKTPYNGIFDIAATGVLLMAMALEVVLQGIHNFLDKQAIRAERPAPVGNQTSPEVGEGARDVREDEPVTK